MTVRAIFQRLGDLVPRGNDAGGGAGAGGAKGGTEWPRRTRAFPGFPRLRGLARRFPRLFGGKSVRFRLVLAFTAILGLGGLNVVVYYHGAVQRGRVFDDLHRAVERHTLVQETLHAVESRHRQVKLITELFGVDGPPPSEADRDAFAARADEVPALLARAVELAEADGEGPGESRLDELYAKTVRLAESWKRFHASLGVDPVGAIQEVVGTADPLALELIGEDFPLAVAREKARFEEANDAFVRTARSSSRAAWTIFLLAAAVGGTLALTTMRDLLRAIAALRIGAERLGQGDLEHRIPVHADDELATVARSFNQMAERLRERSAEIEEQRLLSESLLRNILPDPVAEELRREGRVEPRYLPDTTILFADFVDFTRLFDELSVDRVVRLLDQMFTEFDQIVRRYGLEKLKTIGDAYMCAGGLLEEGASHPVDTVMAAFEIIEAVERHAAAEALPLRVRVGIHTGPVAMGVVGIDKFAFDVWGESVNFAARLEAASEPNRINLSSSTYLRVKDFFSCEYRGRIAIKEDRAHDMYFAVDLHPELRGAGRPPAPFMERYRAYFRPRGDAGNRSIVS